MIGFGLNIVGSLFNYFLFARYGNETNLLCARINFVFAILFLILYATQTPFLRV